MGKPTHEPELPQSACGGDHGGAGRCAGQDPTAEWPRPMFHVKQGPIHRLQPIPSEKGRMPEGRPLLAVRRAGPCPIATTNAENGQRRLEAPWRLSARENPASSRADTSVSRETSAWLSTTCRHSPRIPPPPPVSGGEARLHAIRPAINTALMLEERTIRPAALRFRGAVRHNRYRGRLEARSPTIATAGRVACAFLPLSRSARCQLPPRNHAHDRHADTTPRDRDIYEAGTSPYAAPRRFT